ncbi:hypothetical protein Agabi119p4_2783 [Agaricus bisporus var. burnettii]|uniref:Uncharacterized protein n=1 Tax=Agaricus bisporus var. burnettii TaxID=192524 RepID=A0A8H7F5V4_AGABI|nr:hypothetical protein Agabi119p4_2783 [Agaricus bisporus var. burnettii]
MATDIPIDTIPITITSTLPAPTTAKSTNNVEYLVRFPPFPPVPEGVQIIPFKDFKERGISIQPGGDDNNTEVDSCGVKTIDLPNFHQTDWCKTETKRANSNGRGGPSKRRKKRKTGASSGPTPDNWEDYWEDREAAYRARGTYDPHSSAYERLCQGAFDFKELRPWPSALKQSGPVYCWGEFLRFAGIPANLDSAGTHIEIPEPTANHDDDSDIDDVDDDDDPRGVLNPSHLAAMDAANKARDRGEAFLTDPALYLRVFFSSYARDRGIIWTDANLTGAPNLMRFFINFLIDNRVLPAREENAMKHDSTRRILDQALKELPITSKLAKAWPDEFHTACKTCWGSKAQAFIFDFYEPMEGVETAADPRTTDNGWGGPADTTATPTENQDPNDWASGDWGTGWEAPPPKNTSGVVTVDVDEEGEFETRVVEVTENMDNDAPAQSEVASVNEWDKFEPPTFFRLLGPTALPLTHTTGIVESSVRRIKAILPPSSDVSKFAIAKDMSPDAVEKTLSRIFGVVVFEPWVNWNGGEEPHLSMPKILDSSRGVVKKDDEVIDGDVKTALPPFDPYKDTISVLVDAAHLEFFSVGMACLATWVQLARVADFEVPDPKKKKKKNAKMERYWYVEELLRVIPSFYQFCG